MQHISVVVPSFYPQVGGIEKNCLYTYSEISQRGLNVELHTLAHSESHSIKETYAGIHIYRYQAKHNYYPKISQKTDIIALHNYQIMPHMFMLLQYAIKKFLLIRTVPVFLTPHGCFLPEWTDGNIAKKLIKKLFHKYFTSRLVNFTVTHVRAVSEYEKHKLVEMGIKPEKITIIHNGVEDQPKYTLDKIDSELRHLVQSAGKYLVQVGRIDHVKNYETVLRALPHTSKDIKYIIVGKIIPNDPYYQKLQKIIQELSLQNRVIFLGELSGISKYYVIDNSIIMVHMSKSESFGNTVKEALVRGIPCIVANNSNLKYLVHDNITGYLIDTYDHLSLAKKINYIFDYNNKLEYNRLKSNLKKEPKSKTWTHTALEVLNLYITYAKK